MNTFEVNGTYGSNNTPCTVFAATDRNGLTWYCVEDSVNVNATYDDINEGVDVESVSDSNMFTASMPINSLDELEDQVNS